MGKTRELDSPAKQGPLSPLRGNGKTLPLTPNAQERVEVSERMGEKREAEMKEMFPKGIPERGNMPEAKSASQKLGEAAKPVEGDHVQGLKQQKPSPSKTPKIVVQGGQVKGKGISAKAQKKSNSKPKGEKEEEKKVAPQSDIVGPDGDRSSGGAKPNDMPPADGMQKTANGQEEPVKDEPGEMDPDPATKEGQPNGEGPMNGDAAGDPKQDSKEKREAAKVLDKGQDSKGRGGADTRSGAPGDKGKKADSKGKIKGDKIEGEESPDKKGDSKEGSANADDAGEDGGEGKDGEKGVDGQNAEPKTAPLVRGNFGEGVEPILLQVNQEALKEFGPESIITRNEDGSTIVLAGNFGPTPDEGPSKDGKPRPVRKQVDRSMTTQMYAPNRMKCQSYLDAFETEGRGMVTSLEEARASISGTVATGAEAAKNDIQASLVKESAAIKKDFDTKKGALRATAKSQKAAVRASEKSSKAAVDAAAEKATQDVQKRYDTNLADLDALEKEFCLRFEHQFTQAPKDLQKACDEVAKDAQALGDRRYNQFVDEGYPEQTTWQDVKWGGDFSKDRYKAKLKATTDSTAAYISSFNNSAKEASDALANAGLPEMLTFVSTSVANSKKELKKVYDKSLADIAAKKKSATEEITTSANTSCDAIDGTLKVGLGSLYVKQKQAIEQLEFNAKANSEAIAKTAQEKTTELETQTQAGIDAINEHIDQTITDVSSLNNPDAEQVNAQLMPIMAQLQGGFGQGMQLAIEGANGVVGALSTNAKDIVMAFDESKKATIAEGDKIKAGNVFTMGKQAKDFAKKAKELETPATNSLKEMGSKGVADLDAEYTKVYNDVKDKYDKLEKMFVDNTAGFKSNLQGALKGNGTPDCKGLDKEITDNAKKAADAIKPRWKRWAMALVSIVVMIVITAVIVAMLIPPACGILAVLAAGAAMGAAGGMVKYGAAVLIMDEEVSWKKFRHYSIEGAVDGVMIAATMIPGLKVPVVLAMGAGGGMIKYGNDIVNGDGQTKFSAMGLLTAAGAGTIDAAINLAGARYAGKVDDAVKALGGPAMLTFKQQLGVFVKKDVTQAVGATISGFIQNTQKNFAADRPFDMDSLSPTHLLWELGTNLAQNKFAEKGTHFIVGKTSKSKAYEKSVLDAQTKGQGESVVSPGADIKSFAEKTLAESQANAEKPVTETKSDPVKSDPTPVKVPEGEGAGQKKSPGNEETNNANAGVEQTPTKKKTEVENPAKVEAEANARKEAEARAKADAEAKAKAEADAKAKADAEAKAKAEAETRAKIEAETRAKAEAEAKAQKEQESIKSNDSESHPNVEPPQDQGGGMKGEGVYKKGEKGDQISELSHKELGDTIIQELGQSGLLPEGASITKKPGDESTLLLTVPDPKNPKNSTQVEVKIDKNFDPSKASSVHGSEQGAAMNTIKVKPDGSLEVTIHLGGEHSRGDIKKMAGHEFSEVVDILGQLSKPKEGATKKEMKKFVEETKQKIAEQQSAGVFKSDGKADPSAMTAHDRASIQELKQLLKEASMAKPESLPAIQESISKLAESMGLKHGPGVDPKVVADRVNLLEQALGTKLSPQEHANLVTTPEHVAALEKNILAPDVQKVTDPDGTIRYLDKSGQEIGRMKDGVLSYSYKGHGGPIVMDPERPTTIIGKYEDVVHPDTGTKWVHDLPEGSFSRQGGEKGGLNMLDVSQAKFDALLVEAGGDIAKRNELFWQRYNEPLLIKAFQEGHNVRLLSDPNDPRTRTSSYERELSTIEGPDGLAAKYGYIFDPSTQTYKPGPKFDGTPGKNVAPEALPAGKDKPIDDPLVDTKKPQDQGLDGKKIEGPKAEEVKTTPKENPVVEPTKETPVETPKETPVDKTDGTKGNQEGVKEGVKDAVKETPKAEKEGGELTLPPDWKSGSKNAPPTLKYILKKFAEQGISNANASKILEALHALPEGDWAVAGGNLNSLLSARAREGNPKYIDMVLDALANPATAKLGQDLLKRAVNQGEAMGRIGEKLSLTELAALDPTKFDLTSKEGINILDKILAKADVKSAQEIHSLIDHSGFPEKGATTGKPDIPRLLEILDRAPSDKPLSTAEVLDAIARANKAREEVMAGNFDLPLSTKEMRKTDGLQGDLQSYLHEILLTSEFGKELAKKLGSKELGKSIGEGKPDFSKFAEVTDKMRGQVEAFVKQAIAERGLKMTDAEIKAMVNTAFGTTRGNFWEAIAHQALESVNQPENVYGDFKLTVGKVDVHPDNTVIIQDGNNLVIKFFEYKTGNNTESSGQVTLRDLINSGKDPMKSLKFDSGLGLEIKKRIEEAKKAGGTVKFEQITIEEKKK